MDDEVKHELKSLELMSVYWSNQASYYLTKGDNFECFFNEAQEEVRILSIKYTKLFQARNFPESIRSKIVSEVK